MKTYQIVALFASNVISGAAFKLLRGHHGREGDAQTRIIGGNEANTSEYPYAVSLFSPSGHYCGGSLIGPDVVLSAA
jgi:secreted trypsin-like serine protease